MQFKEPSLEYCRQRIAEAREMADRADGPGTRPDWLMIAERWEQMAAQAEAREQAQKARKAEH